MFPRTAARRASGNSASNIRDAVDPDADWQTQIRQAVEAYVGHIESTPALTLSWIRELPSLDAAARPSQRRNTQLLTSLLVNLSDTPAMRNADLPPLTQAKAVILVGGLRELTAQAVEDGHSVREIVEPAVQASIALLARADRSCGRGRAQCARHRRARRHASIALLGYRRNINRLPGGDVMARGSAQELRLQNQVFE